MTLTVVADSNVCISALVFGGVPRRFFELASARGFELAASEWLIGEVERVLESRFGWEPDRVRAACDLLWGMARIVPVTSEVRACRDPDDDHILACALDAGAGFIVTGDADLLILNPFREIQIVSPRDFISRFGQDPLPPLAT